MLPHLLTEWAPTLSTTMMVQLARVSALRARRLVVAPGIGAQVDGARSGR